MEVVRAMVVDRVEEVRAMVEAKATAEARDMVEETLLVALNVSESPCSLPYYPSN